LDMGFSRIARHGLRSLGGGGPGVPSAERGFVMSLSHPGHDPRPASLAVARPRGNGGGLVLALLALLCVAASSRAAAQDAGERTTGELRSWVIASAGGSGASASYHLTASLGQPTPAGPGGSENFGISAGFWVAVSGAADVVIAEPLESFLNRLHGSVPNPFSRQATLRFDVAEIAPVELFVYDVEGRIIRRLAHGVHAPGRYVAAWDGRDDTGRPVASGVYLYRLEIRDFSAVRKLVLLK